MSNLPDSSSVAVTGRISEDILPDLLRQLEELKRRRTNNSSQMQEWLFNLAKKELQSMQDYARLGIKNWEQLILEDLNALSRFFHQDANQINGIPSNLQHIINCIARMKARVSSLVDNIDSNNSPSSSPSQPEEDPDVVVRETSQKWKDLRMEEEILKSQGMTELKLSYDNLELAEKLCLLCFSIFPENYVIKKRPLIYWWIGEGFVTPTANHTAEEMGNQCFRKLMSVGLIEPVYERGSKAAKCCRMHPWIRRMVISVAKELRFFNFDSSGNPISPAEFSRSENGADEFSRRACLVTTNRESPDLRNFYHEDLQTLFNVNAQYLDFKKDGKSDGLSMMRKLVVLQLGKWQRWPKHHIEVEDEIFLKDLGSMKHLSYLSLQGIYGITKLPVSIGRLINIKILDLRACQNLEELPAGIASLKNLTHLDLSDCFLLEYIPRSLGSLSELQVLKGFIICNSKTKDVCRLSDLVTLKKLKKLSLNINIENRATTETGEFKLNGLEALRSLTITWGASKTIPSFSFPSNLEKLDVRCLPEENPPDWLGPSELSNLKKLYIRGGKLERLVTHGNTQRLTWKVQVLHLKFLEKFQMEKVELLQVFAELKYLYKFECPKLTSFPCSDNEICEN
ncbi:PREDICTED: disease resistance RPP13-like protein 4 [Nelumbo nucifera]|uniref:Disease resistance RPP13-like protein 4 n=2 Tax=Nelumbo nucifera TaxID=4432 RepID=A0A822ZB88_NELNU|nr:PREDICTED: disease resistance RPP13-like protein 4 [Nelumbo nucifera]DAD43524.1 TPA_asm: hypothetical protein HUJ06_001754 [Nelumbo nucifera]